MKKSILLRHFKKNHSQLLRTVFSAAMILILISYPTLSPIMIAHADEISTGSSAGSQSDDNSKTETAAEGSSESQNKDTEDSKQSSNDSSSGSSNNSNENYQTEEGEEKNTGSNATTGSAITSDSNSGSAAANSPEQSVGSQKDQTPSQQPTDNPSADQATENSKTDVVDGQTSVQEKDSIQNQPTDQTENPCLCQTQASENNNASPENPTCCQNLSNSIENSSTASITNDSQATSNTGSNQSDQTSTSNVESGNKSDEDGQDSANQNSAIATGNADAQALIINETNTNIISSNDIELIINLIGSQSQDIDLVAIFQKLLADSAQAEPDSLSGLSIINNNVANVKNTANVSSDSGNNSITNDDPSKKSALTSVQTGDADASANIVNIINQNLVGNNWLFSIINIFGTWSGNLVVPSRDLLTVSGGLDLNNILVRNNNSADITNALSSKAQTGNNSIDQASSRGLTTSIYSGEAQSSDNATTIANTNITKNNWFFLMINNMGVWNGQIIGWNDATQDFQNIYSFDFNEVKQDNAAMNVSSSPLSVTNTNEAIISNTASVLANTGGNEIYTAGKGAASITTGNANARANVFNLINTNIVGNNWFFAIVNIMGKWTGNTVFAHPIPTDQTDDEDPEPTDSVSDENNLDSALQVKHETVNSSNVKPGDIVKSSIRIKNTGETTLNDTKVTDSIKNPSGGKIGTYSWQVGKLKKGEEVLIEYEMKIDPNALPGEYSFSAKGIATDESNEKVKSNDSKSYLSIAQQLIYQALNQAEENIATSPAQAEEDASAGQVLGQDHNASYPRYASFIILIISLVAYLFLNHKLAKISDQKRMKLNRLP